MDNELTPKERIFKSLRGEKPDVLPAAPLYLSLFLEDFNRAYYIEQYRRCMKVRSSYPVDHAEDTYFRAQALYQSYGIFKSPSDWIEVGPGASKAWAARTEIVKLDNKLYYSDKTSGVCVPMLSIPIPFGDSRLSEASSYVRDVWDLSATISSREDIDEQIPIMRAGVLSERGDLDLPRLVMADYGDHYFISTILDTPYSDAYYLLGFQGLMLIQHDHPDLFHHLLQRKSEQTSEVAAAWADTGIHGVFVEEAFTGADLISPPSYDKYVFTYNQPFFQTITKLGLLAIHYVCGDVVPRLDRISEYDIAGVAVEESKKKFRIDIAEVVEKTAGKITVFGNIDAVRFGIHATQDEVAAEVERQARIGKNARGFVISTGSPYPLDTNPRMVDRMVSAAHSIRTLP